MSSYLTNSFVWLYLFFTFSLPIKAQYLIDFIGAETLPVAERNYFVSQSEDGIYWLGSPSGLTRFDGYTARRIPIRDPDAQIYHDQNVQTPMIPDDQGRLWFSTYSALHVFNPTSGSFRTLQVTENGLPIEQEYRPFFYHALTRELWLRAGTSLWAFNVENFTFRPLGASTSAVHFSVTSLPDSSTLRIIGSRWRGTGLETFDLAEGSKQLTSRFYDLPCNAISSIPLSSDSLLLATMTGLYLAQLNPENTALTPLDTATTTKSISGLIRDSLDRFLVISYLEGVREFDLGKRKFVSLLTMENGLADNRSRNLFKDRYGQIWIPHISEGLNILRRDPGVFINQQFPEPKKISDLLLMPDGKIWSVTNDCNLWSYPATASIPNWERLTDQRNRLEKCYRPTFHAGEDTLYLMGQNTLHAYSLEGKRWTSRPSPYTAVRGLINTPLAANAILSEKGLQAFSYLQDTVMLSPLKDFALSNGQHFTAIHELTDTSFLLAYQGTEVWHVSIRNNAYHILEKINSIGDAYCAIQTSTDKIYVGTSVGLFRIEDGTMISIYKETSSAKDLIVETLFEAEDQGIWFGTHRGLFRYDPTSTEVIHFTKADGLPTNRFLRIPSMHRATTEIWTATSEGLFSFNPLAYVTQQLTPQPYLQQIWLNNIPTIPPGTIAKLNELRVDYRRNSINFQVSAIGYNDKNYAGLTYEIEGYDQEPTQVNFGSTIRYPNLPPGSYTLHLTAINRNGLPAGTYRLAVIIAPPFTQTLTFYLLCTGGLALLIAGFYIAGLRRERLKQLRLRKQQEQLASERDRIAGEVHDDLGGQISSILYLSEEMLLTGTAPDNEYELNRINELSRNSLQNVRDIIFALDNRRATLSALGEQLRGAGETFFGDRKIDFQSSEHYDSPAFELSSRQKRNLTLIVKEAWHNIAKSAKASLVNLNIKEANHTLTITVTDNGIGFDQAASVHGMGGYGLDNMQEKAQAIGGQLTIDSVIGKGTTVQVSWPLPKIDK